MRRLFALAAAVAALTFSVTANAQHYDNTRFGITAGVTSSSSKVKDVDSKSISLYHAGLALEIPLGAGFAIQPEAIYQVKGMSLSNFGESTTSAIGNSFETKVGFVEIPVQIQWGPDLMVFRPYGFIEPFVGYQISSGGDKTLKSELQKVEYGMSLGAGLDIWRLQVSAKYFWNFGDVYKSDLGKTGDVITGLKDGNTFNGFAVSAAIFF